MLAGPAALRERTFKTRCGVKGEGTALGAAAKRVCLQLSLLGKVKRVSFLLVKTLISSYILEQLVKRRL